MTRIDALRELEQKVVADDPWPHLYDSADDLQLYGLISKSLETEKWGLIENVTRAYRGSLDAAHALHRAVLPGYGYGLGEPCNDGALCEISDTHDDVAGEGMADTPARAWLIAIIRALISEEDADNG